MVLDENLSVRSDGLETRGCWGAPEEEENPLVREFNFAPNSSKRLQ